MRRPTQALAVAPVYLGRFIPGALSPPGASYVVSGQAAGLDYLNATIPGALRQESGRHSSRWSGTALRARHAVRPLAVIEVTQSETLRVLSYLATDDPRLIKFALQRLCAVVEAAPGSTPAKHTLELLSRHLNSSDVLVRLWLYKLTGLARIRVYKPWLEARVALEPDPESRTWAAAALLALDPNVDAAKRLAGLGLPYLGTPYEFSSQFFRRYEPPRPRQTLIAAAESEDPLTPMWLALLHGERRELVSSDIIRALVGHHNPRVSEYNIWSLFRDPPSQFADAKIDPAAIASRPAQVRRWAYRLLGKTPDAISAYADLIIERARRETDALALEGLALALGQAEPGPWLAPRVASWFDRETDPLTREALAGHLRKFRGNVPVYAEALAAAPPGSLFLPETVPRVHPQRLLIPITERQDMHSVPRILSVEPRETYLMGVDTVGYSKLSDSDQLKVVRSLFASMEDDDYARGVPAERSVYLSTGDGLIVGWHGTEHHLVPLRVAGRLINSAVGGYKLRAGVHHGPLQWVALENGTTQLVGHAINWTARVMGAAGDGELLISEHYHDTHVKPSRDYLPGLLLGEVRESRTKHGEAVRAMSATW